MIKVLLADDDFIVRTFLSRITDWEKHGYTLVGAAQDGQQALHMIEEYHPDIIITDISMPVMNGIELIRHLKQVGNTACIIVLSCHDDFDYVKEAMKLKANEYVLKNLLTEEKLLQLLDEMKQFILPSSDRTLQFETAEKEREYYLSLLKGGTQKPEDPFYTSAAMAVCIVNYDMHTAVMSMAQQKKFHSSFAQLCYEACENTFAVRCVHVHQEKYALLLDLSDISSMYQRHQMLQQYASAVIRYAERYLAVSVCIGISRAESFQVNAAQCWQEANDALNERFYSQQAVFYGWQIQPCAKEIPMLARQFSENISSYIDQRDGGTIRHMWEQVLDEFQAQHTEARLVQEWLRHTDRMAGLAQRMIPDKLSGFYGMETAYLTFREEILPQTDAYSPAVSQTIHYLQQQHKNNASLMEAAELVHLNPAYLSHIFSKETGITFSEYLLSCRINTAKDLLIQTNEKIKDVGMQSGFNDYRNFCRTFKKAVGMTPQNYRKQGRA